MLAGRLEQLIHDHLPATTTAHAVSTSIGGQVATSVAGQIGGLPVTTRTPFYAASLTKQLIGVLAAIGVVRGELAVDTEVRDLLPGLPAWTSGVRVDHLLHHTAGLPEVCTGPPSGWPHSNTAALDRLIAADPTLAHPPGERYAYSNTGYVVLAEAVARAADTPIEVLIRQRLLEPCGLADSRLGTTLWSTADTPDPPRTVGDGGWWTSLDDLRTWLDALDHARFGARVAALVRSTTRLTDGSAVDYAWGVRVVPGGNGDQGTMITHGGGWPGWVSKTVRIPERSVCVAVLTHGGADETAVSNLGLALAEAAAA